MTDGSRCPGCGELHGDWEKVQQGVVHDGGYHSGIVEVFECGKCGETVEGYRR